MKKSTFKKVFALMLALVLAFATSVPAFAATGGTDYTITITPGPYTDTEDTDRYKAYEIFTGELTEVDPPAQLTEDQKNELSNIKWGADIDVANKLLDELTKSGNAFGTAFDGIKTVDASLQASTVAKILETNGEDEAFVKAFAIAAKASLKPVCNQNDAATDTAKSHPVSSTYDGTTKTFKINLKNSGYYLIVDEYDDDEQGDIISEHILEVVRDRSISVKSDTPEVKKEIVTGNGGYEIGQTITFRLTGTIAENFRNFDGDYYYAFNDTMSKGLTLAEAPFSVEVWTVKAKDSDPDATKVSTLTKDTDYTIETNDTDNGTDIKIEFENLKDITGLKGEHVIVVTYNAYINEDAVIGTADTNTVKLKFSNDPYTEDSTTETPEDKVEVQTFEIDIVKKDSVTGDELDGVTFVLYKIEEGDDSPADDTTYYGVFTDDGFGTYTLDTEDGPWTEDEDEATELVTFDNGVLNIKGLGAGTYYLEEVEALDGYNVLSDPIEIVITATYYTAEDTEVKTGAKKVGQLKSVAATIDGNTSALAYEVEDETETLGLILIEILNIPISTLPRTGGIGNYVFYIGGVLLIAAAVALLIVSKKRTSKEAE